MYEFYLYLYICYRHLFWYIDSCFTILALAAAIYLYDFDKDDLFEVLKKNSGSQLGIMNKGGVPAARKLKLIKTAATAPSTWHPLRSGRLVKYIEYKEAQNAQNVS